MIITTPVTDYIPASILTTLNDIVLRGAADPERLAEVDWRGVYIGNDTRNAVGNQIITGVGFVSRVITFLAIQTTVPGDPSFSVGFSTLAASRCIFAIETGAFGTDNSDCIRVHHTGPGNIQGNVSAIGADGFTLTWAISGVISCSFIYLCRP